jgi:hypothetical protein
VRHVPELIGLKSMAGGGFPTDDAEQKNQEPLVITGDVK